MKPKTVKDTDAVNVRIDQERARALLDRMDRSDSPAGSERRVDERTVYRHACLIELMQPMGDVIALRAPTRNLSRGGMAFLHRHFIHAGTPCCIQLINQQKQSVRVEGSVARCEYLEGGIHQITVAFQQPIDVRTYCDKPPPLRVLLVDDDVQLRRLLMHHLKQVDADACEVENGEAALRQTESTLYDLILMDVEMPVMDGVAAIKALRDKGYMGRIVALTALTGEGDRERLLEAGFDDYLGKPVSRTALQELLDQAHEQPIFSTLSGADGASELIDQFVDDLGRMVSEIEQALRARDRDAMIRLGRALKGSAGSYGFDPISVVARQVEFQAADGGEEAVLNRTVRQLTQLCRLVRKSS